MTREQARAEINSRITELPKAKKRVGGHDTYVCPFCGNGGGKDGDGVSTKDGVHYKCFKCGFSGDYIDIIKQRDGLTEWEIFNRYQLEIDSGNTEPRPSAAATPKQQPENKQTDPLPDYTQFFLQAKTALQESPAALAYLQSRGISKEIAVRFMVGYVSDWKSPTAIRKYERGENKYPPPESPRIIIPTSRHSYFARDIRPDADKNYKAMKEGAAELFNVKALQGDTPIFITEGEIDAISIIEVGGQALALGSTSNKRKLIEVCRKEPPAVPLILSLDNDDAGRKAQTELRADLEKIGVSVYEINIAGEHKDPNEHLTADRAAFTALVNSDPAEAAKQEAEAEKEKYLATAAAHRVSAFMGEVAERANTPAIPTGFDALDAELDGGLYEGLYIMGAISSLGKTTYILQVADQIAQRGRDVLIFSLEMSCYELMAKSISRLTLNNCGGVPNNAKTARGILAGARWKNYSQAETELIKRSISEYHEYSRHIFIHEGVGNIGVERIKQEVQRHISFIGNTPVVIIDYLQIITPPDDMKRSTDKQITDWNVLELKRLSRDKKIPVIAISSFNRDNYTAPVNMASFKESGAVEYSSDILLGLQLAGMDELSQSEGKRAETIRKIEEKKRADPRKAQLKILKNRNGRIGESLYYDYYPKFNCFRETNAPGGGFS